MREKMKNLKIGIRLTLGFAVVLLLLAVVVFYSLKSISAMDESSSRMIKGNYARIALINHMRADIAEIYNSLFVMTSVEDKEAKLKESENIETLRKDYLSKADKMEKLELNKDGNEYIAALTDELTKAREEDNTVMELSLAGKSEEARKILVTKSEPRHIRINEAANKLTEYEEGRIKLRYEEAQKAYKSASLLMLLIGAAAAGFAVIIGYVLTMGIIKPLRITVDAAKRIAAGNLVVGISYNAKDEVGELAGEINTMVENLRDMIGTVNQTAAQVASAADQVGSGSQQISKGAATQASAAEETSSSMEEMAASIQTVAENANDLASNVDETSASINQMVASIEQVAKNTQAMASSVSETSATIEQMTASIDQVAKDSESLSSSVEETSATIEQMVASIGQVGNNSVKLTDTVSQTSATIEEMAASIRRVALNVSEADEISLKAAEDAKAGGEAVELTIDGINRIAETMGATSKVIGSLGKRSEEIGKIVGVIEEIADQTNLLALNAAIEAARAGDAGRGFAVVADEVRKLAERSVVATKEIGEVIKQVQKETEQAVKTAETGAAETLEGKKLADKAGASLARILESVGATNRLMSEINSASSEQAIAAAQVLKTVENMNAATDEVTVAVKEQASGSAQIKKAVENMNNISRQLAGAMKEQSVGGRQIRVAVEDMNRVTGEVSVAAKEQASGSVQIIKAVENMNSMTQLVANATAEQKRGGELVVKAVENISDIARENLGAVNQMASAAENLSFQAESLQRAISLFKIREINVNCWDILHCAMEFRLKCPAYENPEKRCWLIDSTWCKGVQQGDARRKLANCMHCEAYKVMQGVAYLPGTPAVV
jgi:methyl-accepting chemotaxis protein